MDFCFQIEVFQKMSKNVIELSATIYMGSQKRAYHLYEFSDEELESIVNSLKTLWEDEWVDITIRSNTVESMNIHVECYNEKVELDSLIRFEAEGEWLEKQNLYVKFTRK